MANWLHHGVVSAKAGDGRPCKRWRLLSISQNAGDPAYTCHGARSLNGIAFQAACDLVFKGRIQPSGYTEPVLHARRLELKAAGL